MKDKVTKTGFGDSFWYSSSSLKVLVTRIVLASFRDRKMLEENKCERLTFLRPIVTKINLSVTFHVPIF